MAVNKCANYRRQWVVWFVALVAWSCAIGVVVHSAPSDGPSTAGSVAVTAFFAATFAVLFVVGTWLGIGARRRKHHALKR